MEFLPPLPDFSPLPRCFPPDDVTPEGDIRTAFFLAMTRSNCDYLDLNGSLKEAMDAGQLKSFQRHSSFPIRPGFPILVPGQVISQEILAFMRALDVNEIHGYRPIWAFACSHPMRSKPFTRHPLKPAAE